MKSISLKHSFLFTLRLFSCERKKREERRGEFFQIENQLWAAWPGSTVEFEYERKMRDHYFNAADGILFIYSVTDASSLQYAMEQYREFLDVTVR